MDSNTINKTRKELIEIIEQLKEKLDARDSKPSRDIKDKDERSTRKRQATNDITKRNAAEEELKKTTKLLQSIMDNATNEAILVTDQMGIILIWNEGARRLLGYESEEMVGRESIRIFHTEEYLKSGIMDVNIKKMIATGKPLTEELDYITKDGKTISVQEIVSPRFDEDDKFIGMVGMARDITEHKQVEEEMKKKMNELEIFNDVAVDREIKINELRKEINNLLEKLGKESKYDIVE